MFRTHLSVWIHNILIPVCTETKYIGLVLDRTLTWATHIENKLKVLNARPRLLVDHFCVQKLILKIKRKFTNIYSNRYSRTVNDCETIKNENFSILSIHKSPYNFFCGTLLISIYANISKSNHLIKTQNIIVY